MKQNTIDRAVKLIRDRNKVKFQLHQYSIETMPTAQEIFGYGKWSLPAHPELKMEFTVIEDHGSWEEYIDLDYVIFLKDLEDGSLVDKVIGVDLSEYIPEDRQVLRLAFIISNGFLYGTRHELRKIDIDNGWHPRVVKVSSRF